jgi:hypothetical protein
MLDFTRKRFFGFHTRRPVWPEDADISQDGDLAPHTDGPVLDLATGEELSEEEYLHR